MEAVWRRVVLSVAVIAALAVSPARALTPSDLSILLGNGVIDMGGWISGYPAASSSLVSTTVAPDPADYSDAYQGGYDAGYPIGYNFGFSQGEQRGTTAGTAAGDDDGYAAGWDSTYSAAFDAAFTAHYTPGVNAGYSTGLIDGFAYGNWWAAEQDRMRSSLGASTNLNSGAFGSVTLIMNSGTGTGGGGSSSGTLSISTSSLVDWNAHYQSLGFADGKAAGATDGDAAGYDTAYPIAYQTAYDAAFIVGGDEGLATGTSEGAVGGYGAGYSVGYDEGSAIGFDQGVLAYKQSKPVLTSSVVLFSPAASSPRSYVEPTFTITPPVLGSSQDSPQDNVPEPAAGVLVLLAAAAFRRLGTRD
jgi:hypothetical protein